MRDFTYHIGSKSSRKFVKVPKNFVTDFASTDIIQSIAIIFTVLYISSLWFLPNWVGIIYAGIVLFALLITPYGKQGKGAVLHDYLYKYKQIMGKPITRKQADEIFLEAMLVAKKTKWGARLIYRGVRLFGCIAWYSRRTR
jgi:hypothetical protein